jgi:tetratricopeptide (TPR) repeat protein
LANALALQNKTADALVLYKKSLSQLERKYGRQNAHDSETILALGSVYESLGDHDLAASMYHRAFAINQHSFSPYDPAIASSLPNLRRVAPHPQRTQASLHCGTGLNATSLESSRSLVNGVVKSPSNDRLRKDDSTDDDLLSDFQKQMLHSSTDSNAYATRLRNATVQEFALKPSRKM